MRLARELAGLRLVAAGMLGLVTAAFALNLSSAKSPTLPRHPCP
ncbi:hypothetical protein ABZ471_41395 [Streptomyces sp. NPDC005728]